jgi:hypothetical protein
MVDVDVEEKFCVRGISVENGVVDEKHLAGVITQKGLAHIGVDDANTGRPVETDLDSGLLALLSPLHGIPANVYQAFLEVVIKFHIRSVAEFL